MSLDFSQVAVLSARLAHADDGEGPSRSRIVFAEATWGQSGDNPESTISSEEPAPSAREVLTIDESMRVFNRRVVLRLSGQLTMSWFHCDFVTHRSRRANWPVSPVRHRRADYSV